MGHEPSQPTRGRAATGREVCLGVMVAAGLALPWAPALAQWADGETVQVAAGGALDTLLAPPPRAPRGGVRVPPPYVPVKPAVPAYAAKGQGGETKPRPAPREPVTTEALDAPTAAPSLEDRAATTESVALVDEGAPSSGVAASPEPPIAAMSGESPEVPTNPASVAEAPAATSSVATLPAATSPAAPPPAEAPPAAPPPVTDETIEDAGEVPAAPAETSTAPVSDPEPAAPPARQETLERAQPELAAAETVTPVVPQTAAVPPLESLRLVFAEGTAELSDAVKSDLEGFAQELLARDRQRIQLLAYARGTEDTASQARRLSLSRALAVRNYLIDQGVLPTRMDVRALGAQTDQDPRDRVDIELARRQ